MARAMASRCVPTISGTVRSSAFIRSTISSGVARSIAAVRALRRSVSRGSMNVMSSANLCGVVRDPQQHTEARVVRRIVWTSGAFLVAAQAAVASAQYPRNPRGQTAANVADYWVGVSWGLYELGTYTD